MEDNYNWCRLTTTIGIIALRWAAPLITLTGSNCGQRLQFSLVLFAMIPGPIAIETGRVAIVLSSAGSNSSHFRGKNDLEAN